MNSNDFMPLSRGLPEVQSALMAFAQPWALFGGGAVAAYHPARAIHDVDLITLDAVLPEVAAALGVNLRPDDHDQLIVRYANVDLYGSLTIHTPQGACFFEMDEAMGQRIQVIQVVALQQAVPVLAREDNIVLKAILQRDVQDGKQDLNDIHLLQQAGPLDLDYLQWRIERCAARGWADRFLQHMELWS